MRRTLLATLLLLLIASTSLFAVEDSFTVTTGITLIGYMKVSSAAIAANTVTAYTNSGSFDTLGISTSGTQDFSAYMTTLCNNRTGYEVTMTATAMSSTQGSSTTYIDYTVGCGTGSITTNGAAVIEPVTIVDIGTLDVLTGNSEAITLSVDADTFNAAVAGDYAGTVTFSFNAT